MTQQKIHVTRNSQTKKKDIKSHVEDKKIQNLIQHSKIICIKTTFDQNGDIILCIGHVNPS